MHKLQEEELVQAVELELICKSLEEESATGLRCGASRASGTPDEGFVCENQKMLKHLHSLRLWKALVTILRK